jgi:glycosyltransferase involved in cell wall biosynthesis
MTSISACYVVKNEQQFLEESLNSIKDLADEIIILDTGSTDNTLEIAKKFTDKVISYKPKLKYAGAGQESRNESLKHATKEWILTIDGDEIFEKGSTEELKKLTSKPTAIGYTLIQRNYTHNLQAENFKFANKFSFPGYYDNRITRLFKNDKRLKFSSNVHEQIDASIQEIGEKVIDSTIILHHLRELKGKEQEKQLAYLQASLDKLQSNPDDIACNLTSAIIYHNQLRDYTKAVHYYFKVLELDPKNIKALINLSNLLIAQNNLTVANDIIEQALTYHPDSNEILNNKTVYLLHQQKYDEAEDVIKKILKKDIKNANALMNKAFIQITRKEYTEAIQIYSKIISLAPNYIDARLNKASAHILNKQNKEAIAEAKKVLETDKDNSKAKLIIDKLKE